MPDAEHTKIKPHFLRQVKFCENFENKLYKTAGLENRSEAPSKIFSVQHYTSESLGTRYQTMLCLITLLHVRFQLDFN